MRWSPRAGALLALLLGLLAVVLPAGPALAASVTVSLTLQGPSPAQASARAGDTVVFSNNDAVTHTVRASGGGWAFDQAVAPGSSVSHAFAAAGTFRYTDTHQVGVLSSRSDAGSVVVSAPAPAPSASPAPAPSAAAPAPRPARTTPPPATPQATPPATPPATSAPGAAAGPALGPLALVASVPSASAVPSPAVAPFAVAPSAAAPAGAAPSSTPAVPAYAGGVLVQGSAHRYGLPAVLAALAVLGVGSLLVRLLLADPAAQAARRPPEPRG